MEENFRQLRIETSDGVSVVTLCRPDSLNALNGELLEELGVAVSHLEADSATGVVVITGEGERAFAAGADIRELADLTPAEALLYARRGQALLDRIESLGKPVVAAIQGFCLGGGCELALACHLRVAGRGARFGQPEVKLGLIPGFGGTQRLTRILGRGAALELLLTGDTIDAERARELGLVNLVADDAEVLSAARALADRILKNAPQALRFCLEAAVVGGDASLKAGLALEASLFGLCFGTEDAREGTGAFLEKRKPRFSGK